MELSEQFLYLLSAGSGWRCLFISSRQGERSVQEFLLHGTGLKGPCKWTAKPSKIWQSIMSNYGIDPVKMGSSSSICACKKKNLLSCRRECFKIYYTTPTLSTGKCQSLKIWSKKAVCQMSINFLSAQHTLCRLHILATACTAVTLNCSAAVWILRKTVCVIETNNCTYCHILIKALL
jgi:hypothetical protein